MIKDGFTLDRSVWVGFVRLLVIFMFGSLTLLIGLLFIVEMKPFGVGGVGFVRTLWSGLIDVCVLIWFLPLPFCAVTLVLLLVVWGVG